MLELVPLPSLEKAGGYVVPEGDITGFFNMTLLILLIFNGLHRIRTFLLTLYLKESVYFLDIVSSTLLPMFFSL